MRFERNGMAIWYGTPDAPAPGDTVLDGTAVAITVGAQPQDASNRIEIRYRVNQGVVQTVAARWLRSDRVLNAHYFIAQLPPFRPGDAIEYTAVCRCAGRQVPSAEEAGGFTSTFLVTPAALQPLAPEYSRLAADVTREIGSLAGAPRAPREHERQGRTPPEP